MDWNKLKKGIFLVNVLAIVYDPRIKKVLIGKRQNDPYLKNLNWSFPGGMPEYKEDLEYYLKEQVKLKTNLEIDIKQVIFAKTYPEKREFLSIYYYCEKKEGKEKAGELFLEIKWVKPNEVTTYFKSSTSIHPKIVDFLHSLE